MLKDSDMPHDLTGWIHTLAAILALITGSIILTRPKGTTRHKRTGRVYGIAMLVVCVTSFMIYRVHNGFGILHIFAIISTATLILGMVPMYVNWFKNPQVLHFSWMYWSVIGLYCAFAAEIVTRLPLLFDIENSFGLFYALIGLSSGMVGYIGSRFFKKNKAIWQQRYKAPAPQK